jgi:hypothetical protein
MKILFDLSAAQPFSNDDFHGGSEYAKAVFYRLCELLFPKSSLEVFYNPQKNIDNFILEICKTKGFTINLCRNNSDIVKLLSIKNYSVFFSALPYLYFDLVIPAQTKFIYTIHGLRSLEYPVDKYMHKYIKRNSKLNIKNILFLIFPYFMKKIYFKRDIRRFISLFSITNNQTIITVSNHSKYAIFFFFPFLNKTQLKVFYSPSKKSNSDNNNDIEILKSFSLETKKYILLICGDRSEKGAYRGCHILYKLIKQNLIPNDIKVIIIGIFGYKPYQRLIKNNNRFILKGYVSITELECLYKNAHLFFYPSLNEGFGYPPLEAMKYGTLCACSANSAITEICGDSVLYFNPHDETEMSIRILQSFDEEIRNEKIEKAAKRRDVINKKQSHDLDLLIREITG